MSRETPRPVEPVDVMPLLPDERSALLDLLADLDDQQWKADTPCPGWSVHDLAAHLLGDDLGVLSRGRDAFSGSDRGSIGTQLTWDDIVASLNELNEGWVRATRRMSGRLLIELLRYSGERVHEYFAGLDPNGLGDRVSWVGPDPAPHWLNIAREYTERWVHQAQLREALGLPGLDGPRFLSPVIATFVRALPRACSALKADDGTCLSVSVLGEAGGEWSLRREDGQWRLYEGQMPNPNAVISLHQRTFWRHLSRTDRSGVRERVEIAGEPALAEPFFHAVAVIAV